MHDMAPSLPSVHVLQPVGTLRQCFDMPQAHLAKAYIMRDEAQPRMMPTLVSCMIDKAARAESMCKLKQHGEG